jgi:hypothetical protein
MAGESNRSGVQSLLPRRLFVVTGFDKSSVSGVDKIGLGNRAAGIIPAARIKSSELDGFDFGGLFQIP